MNEADECKGETLLEVGGEGGSLTVEGVCDAVGRWRFRARRGEYLFVDLLPGEISVREAGSTGGWTESWEEVLGQLDRYPWARLSPRVVHQEFAERVLAAVRERLDGDRFARQGQLDDWLRAAGRGRRR